MNGKSIRRTMTRWFETPVQTSFPRTFARRHNSLIDDETAAASTISPSTTAPMGTSTCPYPVITGPEPLILTWATRTCSVPMSSPIDAWLEPRDREPIGVLLLLLRQDYDYWCNFDGSPHKSPRSLTP